MKQQLKQVKTTLTQVQIIVTSTTVQLLQQKQSLIKHRTQRWNQILITQATSQVTTKEHALNGAQNLAQAKTTAKTT